MAERIDLAEKELHELMGLLSRMGEEPFRARQIYRWIHQKKVSDISKMTDLSIGLRKRLSAEYSLTYTEPVETRTSKDGSVKFAFALGDGQIIESVYMPHNYGHSVCVSSEAGCAMGCRFCASGTGGLKRRLLASEILSQVYRIEGFTGQNVSNIDIMGTGEPLDNFSEVTRFIRMISGSEGAHISQRNIALSTVGIPEKIAELADEGFKVTLCLSLHAADERKRHELMPATGRYGLSDVLEAVRYYEEKSSRRATFEYILIKGVNDTPEDMRKLTDLLKKKFGPYPRINLIPVNPVSELMFQRPGKEDMARFMKGLEKAGFHVTLRRSMGNDIDSACGQLRRRYLTDAGTGSH